MRGESQMVETLSLVIHAAVVLSMLPKNALVQYLRVGVLGVFVSRVAVAVVDAHTVLLIELFDLKIQQLVATPYVGSLNIEPSLRYALFVPEWLQFYF